MPQPFRRGSEVRYPGDDRSRRAAASRRPSRQVRRNRQAACTSRIEVSSTMTRAAPVRPIWARSRIHSNTGQVVNTRIPPQSKAESEGMQDTNPQPMAMPASSNPISSRSAIMRAWVKPATHTLPTHQSPPPPPDEDRPMPRFCANLSMMFTERPFLDRFAHAAAAAGFRPRSNSCSLMTSPGRRHAAPGWTSTVACSRCCSTCRPATGPWASGERRACRAGSVGVPRRRQARPGLCSRPRHQAAALHGRAAPRRVAAHEHRSQPLRCQPGLGLRAGPWRLACWS